MKKMLFACALFFAALAVARGQAPYKVFTTPKLPPRDALERMNLVMP